LLKRFIAIPQYEKLIEAFGNSDYGLYLRRVLEEHKAKEALG
jgi:hypothetical protein